MSQPANKPKNQPNSRIQNRHKGKNPNDTTAKSIKVNINLFHHRNKTMLTSSDCFPPFDSFRVINNTIQQLCFSFLSIKGIASPASVT